MRVTTVGLLAAILACGCSPPPGPRSASSGGNGPRVGTATSGADEPQRDPYKTPPPNSAPLPEKGTGDPAPIPENASTNEPPKQDPTQAPEPSTGQGPDSKAIQAASLVPWSSTVSEATVAAKRDGGYVVLVFEAPWHVGSKILKKEVFTDPEAAKLLAGAHPVSIDVDDPANKALEKEHQVTAIPVLFFLKPGQKPFGTIDGYYDLDKFKKQLRKVLKSR